MDQKDQLVPDELCGEQGKTPRAKGAKKIAVKDANPLCLSCRRSCKQERSALIASCPRYYPGPKLKREDWKQLALPIEKE
ncbi:hypothetical protein LPW11_05325 [Geomonas sp. RF6]|uniref:hypothetical protein n=1 Tax=Geomonas sp. RF6 TaxID=2897342 RepID=UPI001E3763D1|nr:hypothetical protein [Geomonas sp. RF6]UFS71618.1 hypothetical protein LPW11_05325 [Geomonas sp. RF6]